MPVSQRVGWRCLAGMAVAELIWRQQLLTTCWIAGAAVLFVIVPDLLDHLRRTFAPDSEVTYDHVSMQWREPLLLLDDLGTESTTAWAREKLFQLVNSRYNAHLPTVFTSNVAIAQIDPRIASRMHDRALVQIVVMNAGDYRQRKTTLDQPAILRKIYGQATGGTENCGSDCRAVG